MSQFLIFVRKEFLHMFRDVRTLMILFGLPLVLVLLLGFALTNEIKDAHIVVCDYARDEASQQLIGRLAANRNFVIEEALMSHTEIDATFRLGRVKLAVVFPAGFRDQLLHTHRADLQIVADASDPNTADLLTGYVQNVVRSYATELRAERSPTAAPTIDLNVRALYNPELRAAVNFVPGIIAFVLMLISVMMTSVSIVREKEYGTMEVLLVSPISPMLLILAKLVPYLLLSLVNLGLILILSATLLRVPVHGSVPLLVAESLLFILTALSLGLLISGTARTQQTAILTSLIGLMVPTMLFTGFVFPIENMPLPLRLLADIVPARWFYVIVKNVMIKGAGFAAIWRETLILAATTLLLLILGYKKFNLRLT